MHCKPFKLLSFLLATVLLAGCSILPTPDFSQPQNVYIEQAPLKTKDPTTLPESEETKSSETTAPEETTEPTTVPATEAETQSTTPPVTESETQTATQPPTETETQPTTQPPTETETQPATQLPTEAETQPATQPSTEPAQSVDSPSQGVENEAVVLPSGSAAVPNVSKPVASGVKVKSNEEAIIDYSNTGDGYVMVQYTLATDLKLKVQVKGPVTTYTYNLTPQQWAAFPLSDEDGDYQIVVYKNVEGTKYASVLSLSISVSLQDEFAPFIRSNQYVNFDAAPATVSTAASLAGGVSDPLQKVAAIYNFVVYNMHYDTELAATVTSGYLPDLDSVLAKMSGICFDYAALMTGMLRSQGVPTKLVIGYAGDVYHAWINVYSASTGWVEGVIYFDGVNWQRMDPTFASSGGSGVMDYIGDGTNYSAKYFY